MVNSAQLVLDGDPAEENCKVMLEEGARITAIVRDLLQFARDDRTGPQPTSIADVVGRCLRLLGENIKRHGIHVAVEVPAELPLVHANPQQLQQVLLNLMINAKDALQTQSVDASKRIDITAGASQGATVWCRVRDNGPGIPREVQQRIFEPFVTTRRGRGGTGLGLSVSRSIVAHFGGTLVVDSVPNQYCQFTLELPQAGNPGGPGDEAADVPRRAAEA